MTAGKLGERIRALRMERGLSLGDLERLSGVTKGYLSQLERGEASNPSLDAVKKIAAGLGITLSEISGEKEDMVFDEADLPEGLRQFLDEARAEGRPLPAVEVRMLLGIRCRGRPPRTKRDYALLYDVIERVTED